MPVADGLLAHRRSTDGAERQGGLNRLLSRCCHWDRPPCPPSFERIFSVRRKANGAQKDLLARILPLSIEYSLSSAAREPYSAIAFVPVDCDVHTRDRTGRKRGGIRIMSGEDVRRPVGGMTSCDDDAIRSEPPPSEQTKQRRVQAHAAHAAPDWAAIGVVWRIRRLTADHPADEALERGPRIIWRFPALERKRRRRVGSASASRTNAIIPRSSGEPVIRGGNTTAFPSRGRTHHA